MTDPSPEALTASPSDSFLAPGPSAVVAFVLAALVLMGNNLMVAATQSLLGQLFTSTSDLGQLFATWAVGALLPAAASLLLARRAVAAGAVGWEVVVGRAAFVLAAVALGYTLLMLLGAVLHQQ